MNPYGRLILGSNHEVFYELEEPETVIGRAEGCDIHLDDPYVSRRQARIFREQGLVRIENLGRNPVLLNGECIEKSVLQNGDMILFGKTQVVFQLSPPLVHQTTDFDDSALDPEMTFLLPEHQTLKSAPRKTAKGSPAWRESPLRTALLAALLIGLAYIIFRLF
ncbi:MAG: FHA domain-containing protein [Syntrophobacteraceae bacterium]|nr:FHA domain-containing protein [Syntrophobacteraceae bacterium]